MGTPVNKNRLQKSEIRTIPEIQAGSTVWNDSRKRRERTVAATGAGGWRGTTREGGAMCGRGSGTQDRRVAAVAEGRARTVRCLPSPPIATRCGDVRWDSRGGRHARVD